MFYFMLSYLLCYLVCYILRYVRLVVSSYCALRAGSLQTWQATRLLSVSFAIRPDCYSFYLQVGCLLFVAARPIVSDPCIQELSELPDMVRFSSFENLLCQVDFSVLPLTCVADLCIRKPLKLPDMVRLPVGPVAASLSQLSRVAAGGIASRNCAERSP